MSDTNSDAPSFVGEKFTSAMAAFKMHMPNGDPIVFCSHQFITDDKDKIEFLHAQLKAKVSGISHAGEATSDDFDPMAGLRRRMREELREELRAEQAAPRDLGSTESKPIVPASTAKLASVLASSK